MENINDFINQTTLIDFIEDMLKERIISEIVDTVLLLDGYDIFYLEGCSDPYLKMEMLTPEIAKYTLSGIVFFNPEKDKETSIYEVHGIITSMNGGQIRISSYDTKKYY